MGGHFPFPPALVYGFLALLLLPLPFVTSLAMRLVAGPRERLLTRGLQAFGLALSTLAASAGLAQVAGRKLGLPGGVIVLAASAALVIAGFKWIAETTWARALAGVALSAAIYGGIGWAVFR